jgi:Putative transposase of IS4/5 family (DUF4096)
LKRYDGEYRGHRTKKAFEIDPIQAETVRLIESRLGSQAQLVAMHPKADLLCFELTDNEWTAIRPMLPNKPRGVPRVNDSRLLDGIFWVLRSGAAVARSA